MPSPAEASPIEKLSREVKEEKQIADNYVDPYVARIREIADESGVTTAVSKFLKEFEGWGLEELTMYGWNGGTKAIKYRLSKETKGETFFDRYINIDIEVTSTSKIKVKGSRTVAEINRQNLEVDPEIIEKAIVRAYQKPYYTRKFI